MRQSLTLIAIGAALTACVPDRQPDAVDEAPVAPPTPPAPASAPVSQLEPPAPGSSQPPAQRPDPRLLTLAGLGDIVIGQAPPASLREEKTQISESCRTLRGAAYPGVYVMTDGSRVRRITLMSSSVARTERGIASGASEASVRKAYPALTKTPHEYVESGKNLTFRPAGSVTGLRFEIDAEARANLIHAGSEPWLAYSEGCA